MSEKITATDTRHRRRAGLRPEYVALGLLAEGPAHGYELYRRFTVSLDGVWHISESQFYTLLSRLEARGLVSLSAPEKGGGAQKFPLCLSAEGTKAFYRWLGEPTASSPRMLHLEFLARLYFASRLTPESLKELIQAQYDAIESDIAHLERLRAQRPPHEAEDTPDATRFAGAGSISADTPGAVTSPTTGSPSMEFCSADFRCRQLRAALAWIRETASPAFNSR